MDIRPVGFPTRDSGHYRLLIDSNLPPLAKPIPVDFNHLDFRDGQTLAKITLTPGEHTLQLLLVDDNNMAHDPPVISAPLKVIVADLSNRDDRNRNDSTRRGSSPPSSSQNGPSQYDPSSNGYGHYQDARRISHDRRHRSRSYRYDRARFRHGRGWYNDYYRR
jgi:hypothetical protein